MAKERITILDNEEFLRQVSAPVDFEDKSYLEDIKKLKDFCQNDGVFALAPVQIGIPKRIIYIRNSTSDIDKLYDATYDESKIYINPVILKRKGLTKYLEGCASCPGIIDNIAPESDIDNFLLVGIVERPYSIEVEYYDVEGTKNKETIEGFESTVFSHEYNHLNGVLHLDLIKELWNMDLKTRNEYRKNHPYEIISKDCNYD